MARDDVPGSYKAVQKRLIIDVRTLDQFHLFGLRTPWTKFLSIIWQHSSLEVVIKSHDAIEVHGIPVDPSMLSSPLTVAASVASEERPLAIVRGAIDLFVLRTQPPLLRIDVSEVDERDAHVRFSQPEFGRQLP